MFLFYFVEICRQGSWTGNLKWSCGFCGWWRAIIISVTVTTHPIYCRTREDHLTLSEYKICFRITQNYFIHILNYVHVLKNAGFLIQCYNKLVFYLKKIVPMSWKNIQCFRNKNYYVKSGILYLTLLIFQFFYTTRFVPNILK